MALTDQTIKLADGRALGYAEFGDPSGMPVLFFHGFPASRLEGIALDTPARTVGVRLIAPDRPGFGLSDPKPGRSFSDWPDDVIQLAVHLSIYDFAVLGTSGGSPYVVACADRISERLTAAGIVSGISPLHNQAVRLSMNADQRRMFVSIARFPWLARRYVRSKHAGGAGRLPLTVDPYGSGTTRRGQVRTRATGHQGYAPYESDRSV